VVLHKRPVKHSWSDSSCVHHAMKAYTRRGGTAAALIATTIFHSVQTGPEVHPASYPVGTVHSFSDVITAGE
jgi:hypothetical protein